MTHRRPNIHVPDHDSPIMRRLRASVLARHPVTEITDPAERDRIAAEVERQAAAKVPLCVISPLRGGSYSSDPLPKPKPTPPQEPPPMPSTPPSPLAAPARIASANLADHMPEGMTQRTLAEKMAAIDPDGRRATELMPTLRAALRPSPALTSLAYPLACAALGLTLRDISQDEAWIAAQPPLALPAPVRPLPVHISAFPEDDGDDDHHTPDGPLPSLPLDLADDEESPFGRAMRLSKAKHITEAQRPLPSLPLDLPDEDPDPDLTSHITGIRPRAPASTISPVLDPALELGRSLTRAVDAAVAAALRSVEARATKAEGAAATAQAQAQALAVQVEILSRRLDRLRDVL